MKWTGSDSMKENKICRICGREFYKKSKGRIRMTLKIEKGEKVIWICPECAKKLKVRV